MMQIANFRHRDWRQYSLANFSVWITRFARAVGNEIKQLPAQPPPLPWPVYQKPVNELRKINETLYPKFGPQFEGKPKPSTRKNLTSYVPSVVAEELARTEVYRGEEGENFVLRVKKCWDTPRPWSIEAVVDPGSTVYLPFFREVTIRLPLKAKVCRELKAKPDGRWVGECRSVKKLNAREPIAEVTRWLLESGQSIREPVQNSLRTAGRPDLIRTNHPKPQAASPLLSQGGELCGRDSPGAAAYRAKSMARTQRETQSHLARHLPLDGALHVEGFFPSMGVMRWTPRRELDRLTEEHERLRDAETDVIRVMMHNLRAEVTGSINDYVPPFLNQDDLDGYLVTEREVGPDPYSYFPPDPRYRSRKWWRGFGHWRGQKKRLLTARERLARVKPSLKIVPTGPRSAELVITRRMHELNMGLGEALNLARMIEGAIKYRNPPKPERKKSWRQELRRRLLNDTGRFIWLVRNPVTDWDSSRWTADRYGQQTLDLGPISPDALRSARDRYRPRPGLTELFPHAALPKHYVELIDRKWLTGDKLTDDVRLFKAAPAGDFATNVEGFPVRLPVAVMPPAAYERWRIPRRRQRKRRTRNRAGCSCAFRPPVFRAQPGLRHAKSLVLLRN
jgi:hypothetical protein